MCNSVLLGAFPARHRRNRSARRRIERLGGLLIVVVALEYGDQLRDLQQIADAFCEIRQLDVSTSIASGGEEADHGPNAAAIDVANFSEIQHKTIVFRQFPLDRLPQLTGFVAENN